MPQGSAFLIKIKDFNQEIVSEPVGDDAHIVPQMCRDILVRVDEGIDPYERALRSSLHTARFADWCDPSWDSLRPQSVLPGGRQ